MDKNGSSEPFVKPEFFILRPDLEERLKEQRELDGRLFWMAFTFSVVGEDATGLPLNEVNKFLDKILNESSVSNWSTSKFKVLLYEVASGHVWTYHKIKIVHGESLFARLGMLLINERLNASEWDMTSKELEKFKAENLADILECSDFLTFLQKRNGNKAPEIKVSSQDYFEIQEMGARHAISEKGTAAGSVKHKPTNELKQRVFDRFQKGRDSGKGKKYGEWRSLPAAASVLYEELVTNHPIELKDGRKVDLLKPGAGEKTIVGWLREFLRSTNNRE